MTVAVTAAEAHGDASSGGPAVPDEYADNGGTAIATRSTAGSGISAVISAVAAITGLDPESQLVPIIRDGWLNGMRPVRALIEAGALNTKTVDQVMAAQVGTISIEPTDVTAEAARMLPQWFCEQHLVVPVSVDAGSLVVASEQSLRQMVQTELEQAVGCPVVYRVASQESVAACLAILPSRREDATGEEDQEEGQTESVNESVANWQTLTKSTGDADTTDAEVVRHVESLMTHAIATDTSDIHIQTEIDEDGSPIVTARLRRLGDLMPHAAYTAEQGNRLINRLKVAGGFDVDPTRPCDGRYDITIPGSGRYDLRLAGMPLSRGQMLVIRMLPHMHKDKQTLDSLFPAEYSDLAERVNAMVTEPEGMLLVVGSTGSGKSTTLTAMIRPLAEEVSKKVLTIEDPVEHLIFGAEQVEVTPRMGFADALRGFLRSDPDAILVGEIRDTDTASMAVQAAQTGHIVMSTMHASAVELTPNRLNEMGVSRSNLADVLLGVLSQKLVKTLCEVCSSGRQGRSPEPRGCESCAFTGWGGRMAIAELMEVTGEVANLISSAAPLRELRRAARIMSYSRFAAGLIDMGVTTREAVRAVLGRSYDHSLETGFREDGSDG